MVRNHCQYYGKMAISWIPPLVNSKVGVDFAMLFPLRESRMTSDSALLRVRSKELRLHPQTPPLCGMKLLILFCEGAPLDSEALRLLHRWGNVTGQIFYFDIFFSLMLLYQLKRPLSL